MKYRFWAEFVGKNKYEIFTKTNVVYICNLNSKGYYCPGPRYYDAEHTVKVYFLRGDS